MRTLGARAFFRFFEFGIAANAIGADGHDPRRGEPPRQVRGVGEYEGVIAMGESQIGLHKTELIRLEGAWRGVERVERETLNWVDWFNRERPHEALDDLTPAAADSLHCASKNGFTPTG